jgi:hypothetical protein
MSDTPCVFGRALDADLAHLLWLANVSLSALQRGGRTPHRIPLPEGVSAVLPPLSPAPRPRMQRPSG